MNLLSTGPSCPHLAIVAIPLNRPPVIDFLLPPSARPKGARLQVVGQRPTVAAEAAWLKRLQAAPQPDVADLLAIDDPHAHLVQTWTDRLLPMQFLTEPGFLTRNMGGWSAIFFGVTGQTVTGQTAVAPDDPLLQAAETLLDYGSRIISLGADPALVAERLEAETGCASPGELVAAIGQLHAQRRLWPDPTQLAEQLYRQIATGTNGPIPRILLLDELLGQLVRLELRRRTAVANQDRATAEAIAVWQEQQQAENGLFLILKGEYIVGRHRRSTVLIAPALGVVVKQPAPEPLHEIELNAKSYDGRSENWPRITQNGALVTPRGRLRLTLEEGLVPRLHEVFRHKMDFSTLLGLTVEPFVVGQTVQEWVLADPARMTPALYETFVLHQQVCERLGVENGDWHSANFVRRDQDGAYVHIDWGAARPLQAEELTSAGRRARLNQVQNIAYSFHDDALAERVLQLHQALVADNGRLGHLQQRAVAIADG
jgi:hypothetical protein